MNDFKSYFSQAPRGRGCFGPALASGNMSRVPLNSFQSLRLLDTGSSGPEMITMPYLVKVSLFG